MACFIYDAILSRSVHEPSNRYILSEGDVLADRACFMTSCIYIFPSTIYRSPKGIRSGLENHAIEHWWTSISVSDVRQP